MIIYKLSKQKIVWIYFEIKQMFVYLYNNYRDKDNNKIDRLVISDVNKLAVDIVNLRTEIENIEGKGEETGASKEGGDQTLNNLRAQLEEKRLKVKDILDGKDSEKYVAKTLAYLNPNIHSSLISLDKVQYTESVYKKNYNELPEDGAGLTKESLTKEFDLFMKDPNLMNKLDVMFDMYSKSQETFSKSFKEYADGAYKDVREKSDEIRNRQILKVVTDTLKTNPDSIKEFSRGLDESDLKNFTLNDMIKTDTFNYLVDNKIIDVSEFTPEEISELESKFKYIDAMPFTQINQKFVSSVVAELNTINADPTTGNGKLIKISGKIDVTDIPLKVTLDFLNSQDKIDNELFLEVESKIKPIIDENINKLVNSGWKIRQSFDTLIDSIDELDLDPALSQELKTLKLEADIDANLSEIKKRAENGENYVILLNDYLKKINKFLESTKKTIRDNAETKGIEIQGVSYELDLTDDVSFSQTIENVEDGEKAGVYLKELDAFKEYINSELTLNLDKDIVGSFNKLKANKQVEVNPIFDLLRNLEFSVNGETTKTIFNLLEEESNTLSQSIIENYLKEDFSYDLIKRGISVLQLAKSIATGMATQTTNGREFGFNQSMKNYLEKYQEGTNAAQYETIEDTTAVQIYNELGGLETKLNFLLTLSDSNTEAKEKEHFLTRSKFAENISKHYQDYNLKYKGKDLVPNKEDIFNSKDPMELKNVKYEVAVYKAFKEIPVDEYDAFIEEVFAGMITPSLMSSMKNSNPLTPSMTDISQKNLFFNLLKILSVDSNEVNIKLKEILENPEFKFAPFFGQEYAAATAFAAITNKKLFDIAMAKVSGNADMNAGNIISILGISGSGKTSVTGQYVLKFLLGDESGKTVYVSGPNKNRIDGLNSALLKSLSEAQTETNNFENKDKIFFIDDALQLKIVRDNKFIMAYFWIDGSVRGGFVRWRTDMRNWEEFKEIIIESGNSLTVTMPYKTETYHLEYQFPLGAHSCDYVQIKHRMISSMYCAMFEKLNFMRGE